MDINKIKAIVGRINDKLNKLKIQSENIFSTNDENDFFQHFLNFCADKSNFDKSYAQRSFYDKIKNWYHKFLGENRSLNLEEFKFINEESKLLAESVCDRENLEHVRIIFDTWKKHFNYNYKTKFSLDVSNIQKDLDAIINIAEEFSKGTESLKSKIDLGQDLKAGILAGFKPITVKTKPEKRKNQIVKSKPKPSKIEIPTPESLKEPKEEPSVPTEETPSLSVPTNLEDELKEIKNVIQNLGINLNDVQVEKIRNLLQTDKIGPLIDLINAGDIKDINFLLN